MPEVAQPVKDVVSVVCLGIATPVGFNLTPDGYDPTYVAFTPGQVTVMARHYADYLVKQDPTRFVIGEKQAEKVAAAAPKSAEAKKGGPKASSKKK